MRKWKFLVISISLLLLSACAEPNPNYVPPEQPHLYYKTITATVTDNDTRHWFATTHWYEARTTVYSEEYDLENTLTTKGSGVFGCPWEFELKEGDKVEVKLYSWVYDSTGKVIKRKIHCIERRVEK